MLLTRPNTPECKPLALGCIFAELLQRQQQTAITPKLTISPLFRFDDEPIDQPGTAEMYTAWAANGHGRGRSRGRGGGHGRAVQVDPRLTPGGPRLLSALEPAI